MDDPSLAAQRHHFGALDGWRGICACMVALFHFRANSHITASDFIQSGGAFLDFFFVLSGFVIFSNYHLRLTNGYPLGKFMLLRFGRLYPLHFAILMLFLAGDFIQLIFPSLQSGATYAPFSAPGEGPRYILANLFLVHSFGVTDQLSFNAPSWSISAEFYTYIFFALAIIWGRGRIWAIALLTAATISIILVEPQRMGGTASFGILRALYGFGCGGLIWFLYERLKHIGGLGDRRLANLIEAALTVACFAYVQFLLSQIGQKYYDYFLIASPLLFSATVLVFAFERGFLSKILKSPVFATLGTLSYSIYMIHIFVSGKIFYGFGHLLERKIGLPLFTVTDGVEKLGTDPWIGDAICFFYFISVICASYVTYRVIEMPCRDRFRRRADRLYPPRETTL